MDIAPGKTVVGWIGTGIMGASMAGHIQRAGYALRVHNRTRAKAEALLKAGAVWCDSPAEVAGGTRLGKQAVPPDKHDSDVAANGAATAPRSADVVFTIVGFPADVEQVHLGTPGQADGIIHGIRPGAIVIDMTTSSPALARKLAEAYAARGVACLDAPVSGGDIGAREARLAIMVGGDEAACAAVRPLLGVMGKVIARLGGPGAGQHTKMCNQILIAGTMIGVCESLLYAAGAGLDQQAVIAIIGQGAAGGWSINNLGPRIVRGNLGPGFLVDHFVKDMGIALREAAAMGLALPGLALAEQLYRDLQAAGGGRNGTQALIRVLETMAKQMK